MKQLLFTVFVLMPLLSVAQVTIDNKSALCQELREMLKNDQLHRGGDILGGSFGTENKHAQKDIDSVWKLQIAIDNANTERLIQLTETYGWLSDERVDCPKLNIWLIFRHSQNDYFEQIATLIDKEKSAGRLSDWHYKLIKNHLEGRPKMGH